MRSSLILILSQILLAACAELPPNSELSYYYQAETDKPYADVIAELEAAIAEHNFRITGHSRVGKVIRERGADNYPEYDTIQFCNLTLAKTVLDITPHAIGYMPCNIVTYQYAGKTIIKIHILPEDTGNEQLDAFARQMNPELKAIVDFAAKF